MARVFPNQVQDVNSYQYWNGSAYTSQRLIDPATADADPPAILQGVSVGSAFYSSYYSKYVVLAAPNANSVVAYTAQSPEGPYSDPVTLWSNTTYGTYGGYNNLYAPEAITALDSSGKTLVVNLSWTRYNAVGVILKFVSFSTHYHRIVSHTHSTSFEQSQSDGTRCFGNRQTFNKYSAPSNKSYTYIRASYRTSVTVPVMPCENVSILRRCYVGSHVYIGHMEATTR